MSKLGIGKALALAGVIALTGGAISLAAKGDEKTDGADVRQVDQDFGPHGIDDDDGPGDDDDGPGIDGPGWHGPGGMDGPGDDMDGPGDRDGPPSAADMRKKRAEFAKALGEELDKSQKEVEAALRNVFKDRLDQAVKDEDLTQKQADAILKCYDSADCMHPGMPPGPPM